MAVVPGIVRVREKTETDPLRRLSIHKDAERHWTSWTAQEGDRNYYLGLEVLVRANPVRVDGEIQVGYPDWRSTGGYLRQEGQATHL